VGLQEWRPLEESFDNRREMPTKRALKFLMGHYKGRDNVRLRTRRRKKLESYFQKKAAAQAAAQAAPAEKAPASKAAAK
jgi:hypothetical protein